MSKLTDSQIQDIITSLKYGVENVNGMIDILARHKVKVDLEINNLYQMQVFTSRKFISINDISKSLV